MILDPATASLATGVPVRTIQRWALAGRIGDHGDGLRLPVNVDEVPELEELRATPRDGRLPSGNAVALVLHQPVSTVTRRPNSPRPP